MRRTRNGSLFNFDGSCDCGRVRFSAVLVMEDEWIIRAVRCRSALYDRGDTRHSNRGAFKKLWAECAAELGVEVEVVKKRWAYLRDYFVKQYRSSKSFSGSQRCPRKIKWPLYDSMLFLIPYIQRKEFVDTSYEDDSFHYLETLKNEPRTPEDEAIEEISVDVEPFLNQVSSNSTGNMDSTTSSIGSPSSSRKRQKISESPGFSNEDQISGLSYTSEDLSSALLASLKQQHIPDDHEYFFKSLLPTVRQLDNVSAMEFRVEVQKLLLSFINRSTSADTTS